MNNAGPTDWTTTLIMLGILVLLLAAGVFMGLFLKSEWKKINDHPDDPRWWERPDSVPEPKWPKGGEPLPKKKEKKLEDADLRVRQQ